MDIFQMLFKLFYHLMFQNLSMEDYRYVMKVVENAILSTDLAMYFKKNKKFMELIENGEFDWQSEEKKECEYHTEGSLFISFSLSKYAHYNSGNTWKNFN